MSRPSNPDPGKPADAVLAIVGSGSSASFWLPFFRKGMEVLGLSGDVRTLSVSEEDFKQTILRLKSEGVRGVFVLEPFRAEAGRLCERFYEAKYSLGQADTLLFEDAIYGINTQVPAFYAPLKSLPPATALILGGRALGRMAALSLRKANWEIRLWNQGALKSRVVAAALKALGEVKIVPTPDPAGCSLIVNATGLGKKVGEEPPVLWQNAMRKAVAYDLITERHSTEFLRSASLRGLKTISGREMIVEQVALALEWLFGKNVPRDPLRELAGIRSSRPPKV
ncbi:MAG: hypothetical protein K6T17_08985 [Fimbriimonadales bacterium]|nr:hypothetical protein [Fimbriimonadales bacterium]